MNVANYLTYSKQNASVRVTSSSILKECHIHIVLVQLYVEPANDFDMLVV